MDTLNISVLRVNIIFACGSKRIFNMRNQSSFAEVIVSFYGIIIHALVFEIN